VPIVLKSGSLNLLEPSGPVQACNGIALPFYLLDATGCDIYFYDSTCFQNFLKLCPLEAATTKACLNKILNDNVVTVRRLNCILSDNGTQFASQIWKNILADMKTDVLFAPIRHPQANTFERYMKESGNFCLETYKNGQNPYLTWQGWLSGTLSDLTF
jgi:hypothetical protein